jgi:hypothetical protein
VNKVVVGLIAVAITASAAEASVASASGASAVTVPKKANAKVTTSWTGTVPLGSDPTATACSAGSVLPPETHKIAVKVAPGAYKVVDANLALVVDSSPTLNGDFIELIDPSGQSVGTDQQKPEMTVNVPNPVPGTWTAVVCQFLPDDRSGEHPYQGRVEVTTTKHKR